MAGRDFASVRASSRRKPAKPSRKKDGDRFAAGGVLVALVAAGLAFAAGYLLGQQRQNAAPAAGEDASIAVFKQQLASKERQLISLQKELERLQRQRQEAGAVEDLTFYSELPEQSVTPAPLSETPAEESVAAAGKPKHDEISAVIAREMSTKPAKPAQGYRIQVGSFRRQGDAEAMAGKLKRQGFATYVQAVQLAGKGRWHRVYVGPFHSTLLAEHAKRELEKKLKLRGLVVRGGS